MAFDLEQRQTAALQDMLQLRRPQANAFGGRAGSGITPFGGPQTSNNSPWKILIFDDTAKDILAPLMTIGVLRRFGVTLPLVLSAPRTPIVEAPAVYLVSSTEANIQRIVSDLEKRLYAFYYVNFVHGVDKHLLQQLAEGAARAGAVGSVVSVVDRHVGFVCLSPCEFSLNLGGIFSITHGAFEDAIVEEAIGKTAEGLLSVIATLGVLPTLSCPASSSSPARSVALRLQELVQNLPPQAFSQMFGSAAASVHKPLLILLDREFDLLTMLQHTWLYGALMHDLLKLRLNRVTVTTQGTEGKGPATKTFDLEKRDVFWGEHAFSPFPVAAAAVSQMLSNYNAELAKVGHGKTDAFAQPGSDFSSDILKAVDALPDLADKKRSLDAHTTIATALVDAIKERGLDRYFEIEQGMSQDREAAVTSAVRQTLGVDNLGTKEDKLRLLACLYLSRSSYPKPLFDSLVSELASQNVDVAPINFLCKFSAFRSIDFELRNAAAGSSSSSTAFEGIGTKFLDKGRGLLQGVKNLLVRKTSPIAQVVESLVEGHEAQGYQTLSLKRGQHSSGTSSTTVSPGGPQGRGAAYRQSLVFVMGGASHVEAAALREVASKTQRQIIFGSTEFVTPNDFLEELAQLGRQ